MLDAPPLTFARVGPEAASQPGVLTQPPKAAARTTAPTIAWRPDPRKYKLNTSNKLTFRSPRAPDGFHRMYAPRNPMSGILAQWQGFGFWQWRLATRSYLS